MIFKGVISQEMFNKGVLLLPLGNGAEDFPQLLVTISVSSEKMRFPSASVPQTKGTLPSASCKRSGYVCQVREENHSQI